ncbi:MAG: Lysine biosynthesis protein LysW [candidate division CPR2 bacterium GW2011_GWC1_39_9]|nr:MAG: Lysine biosynthesis protein LysW [candidate division CPR2 bacterium GW2011_GWC1_39_9]
MIINYMGELLELKCPDCGETIILDESFEAGELVICGNCGLEMEILEVDPLKFRPLEEEK